MDFSKDSSYRVKGIAVILLVFLHIGYSTEFIQQYGMTSFLPMPLVIELATLSKFCVTVFVFISSYGLALLFAKNTADSIGRFVFKRWIRLMSAYWVVYPIQILLYMMNGGFLHYIFGKKPYLIAVDLLGLSAFFKTPLLTGVNWYMFLAQLILFLTPIMSAFTRKFGILSLVFMLVIMQFIGGILVIDNGGDLVNYTFVFALGNYCATNEVFNKIQPKNKAITAIITGLLFLGLLFLRYLMSKSSFDFRGFQSVVFAFAALVLCIFVSLISSKDVILKCLGKYSANMYFTHIFFVHSPTLHRYITDVFLLLIICLILSFTMSVVIELIKQLIGFNKIITKVSALGSQTSVK